MRHYQIAHTSSTRDPQGRCPNIKNMPATAFRRGPRVAEAQPEDVIKAAADFFRVRVADLTSQSRAWPIVHYRQAAMLACRMTTSASLPAIARAFGKKDHTTVLHGLRRANQDHAAIIAAEVTRRIEEAT